MKARIDLIGVMFTILVADTIAINDRTLTIINESSPPFIVVVQMMVGKEMVRPPKQVFVPQSVDFDFRVNPGSPAGLVNFSVFKLLRY